MPNDTTPEAPKPDTTPKPAATPAPAPAPAASAGLPPVKIPGLTAAEAKRFSLLALVFAALSICSSGVAAMGFLPVWALQLCAGLALIFTGLSWLFHRQAPSATEIARQGGGNA